MAHIHIYFCMYMQSQSVQRSQLWSHKATLDREGATPSVQWGGKCVTSAETGKHAC